ncbi:Protein DJ-1-like D [Vitis vinifera]|uniref:Protein DJ-1-like D n=1 Tax=Vitis vinifera TaxID=29760 RepID=A0A438E256_VITVI|nr:Protein DJ-1-like D [Vitis vinifera]
MAKSVLILCGDYMEDYEVMVPFQALLAYGVSVHAVCPGKKAGDVCRTAVHQGLGHQSHLDCGGNAMTLGMIGSRDAGWTYSESRGHNFTVNATFDEVDASKYDGLVIPGGRAPEYLAMNESVFGLGSVRGRKCTAYPAVGPALIAAGAHWVEPETMSACVIDGNLITAATYIGHPGFIQLFVKALGGTITGSDKRILFLCGSTKGINKGNGKTNACPLMITSSVHHQSTQA